MKTSPVARAVATLAVLAAALPLAPVPAAAQLGRPVGAAEAAEAAEAGVGRPVPAAPTIVYAVRHAETAGESSDPGLSARGRARAERLARMLADAGLTAVHATPYQRTRRTAAIVAEALGLEVREYDPRELPAFAARLAEEGGTHLVVGHSNTTPALVQLLGGDPGGPIPEGDYGRVYQLTIPAGTGAAGDPAGRATRTAILGYPGGFLADPPPAAGARPEADPADVRSIDAIMAALYDVISGPVGEPRDWDRLRGLFLPSARMIPTHRTPDGRVGYRAMTVEEYIQGSGRMIESIGFREREVARTTDRFGDVAQVFSTYEGTRGDTGETFLRGINSVQLIFDGDRWWITSLAWSPTRPDLPIPPRYQADGDPADDGKPDGDPADGSPR